MAPVTSAQSSPTLSTKPIHIEICPENLTRDTHLAGRALDLRNAWLAPDARRSESDEQRRAMSGGSAAGRGSWSKPTYSGVAWINKKVSVSLAWFLKAKLT